MCCSLFTSLCSKDELLPVSFWLLRKEVWLEHA